MSERENKKDAISKTASRLLQRGGRSLCLAAYATSKGVKPFEGKWSILDFNEITAAEEIMQIINKNSNEEALEVAINAAMDIAPATKPPSWAEPVLNNLQILEEIGRTIDEQKILKVMGLAKYDISNLEKGFAALAIAMCRSFDSLLAFSSKLPEDEAVMLLQMGCMARATVDSGEPSRFRKKIKGIING